LPGQIWTLFAGQNSTLIDITNDLATCLTRSRDKAFDVEHALLVSWRSCGEGAMYTATVHHDRPLLADMRAAEGAFKLMQLAD